MEYSCVILPQRGSSMAINRSVTVGRPKDKSNMRYIILVFQGDTDELRLVVGWEPCVLTRVPLVKRTS